MSTLNEINYEPLLALNGAWRLVFRKTIPVWGPVLVIVWVAVSLLGLPALAFDLGLAIIILYAAMVSTKVNKLKNGIWWQFAIANGWSLDTATPLNVIVPPSLQFGHNRVCSPVVQALLNNLTCDILTYRCVTGYGKSEQVHNFTLASISLPQALPHMLLLSKKARADVQRDLADAENLHLEGDFDDYFSLQIEKGQEVNALTVISPDVMQTLVQYNQAEDIEILGNNLYLIMNNDKRDYRDMQTIIRSVVELGQQILENLKLAAAPKP